MNPARLIKIFLFIFGFLGLAGFSFDAYAQSYLSGRCSELSPTNYRTVVVPEETGLNGLCLAAFGVGYGGYNLGWYQCGAPVVGACAEVKTTGVPPEQPLDPDSPFCLEYPDSSICAEPEPEPEPEPLEPDDPYCLDDPMNPLCSPEEPSPMECDNGVGSEACCASYAHKACEPYSVGWWSPGYGLGGYVTSCSYSCQYPADPSEPDPYDPPDPNLPDPTMPPPVSPGDPSNPSVPSDPDDPVSVDLSGVNERLDILTGLNTDGFNMVSQGLDKLDRNNQVGLDNVRRSVDSGFSDLARRLDPSGSPSFNPNAFGDGGFTGADSDEMKALLGITGDESYSDLERTINLDDYADDYTFTLPDATCPAPRQLGLSFGTFELNYEPVCEIFDFLGTLVVLTALFLTPIIIFRGL